MTLETNDLAAIEAIVSNQLDAKLASVKSDISEVRSELKVVNSDLSEVRSELKVVKSDLLEVKRDVSEMKKDVAILATLNQLEDIKKDPRLRILYKTDTPKEA